MIHNATVSCFLTLIFACSANVCAGQTIEIRGRTMGPIPFKVLVATDKVDKKNQELVQRNINLSLQRVNELMSTYIPNSDVSRFNSAASNEWVDIDSETLAVISKAIEIAKLTDGAFDPTVGPAVNAWNFGPDKTETPQLPDAERIERIRSRVGYEKVELRSDPPAIRKLVDKVQLDLSAIAKGYAVDRVKQTLNEMEFENCMVEVGGEVATSGQRAAGGPWNVAIDNPSASSLNASSDPEMSVIQISGSAVATSGDYRNFIDINGKRYSHTINPETCWPVKHNLALASVVADDCMTADAIATAVMVMGMEKGKTFCNENGFPLLAVSRSNTEDGNPLVRYVSSQFPIRKNTIDGETNGVPGEVLEKEADSSDSASESKDSILPVFAATFAVFLLMVLGMAVGAIFNNKPVTGSCGGIANMRNEDGESVCGICSKPTTDCTEQA